MLRNPTLPARPKARVAGSLVAVGLLVMILAAAAPASVSGPGASKALGTVTVRLAQDYQSLSPYVDAGRAQPWAAASPGYDRLVTWGPKGAQGPYLPYLATSWKKTTKSITFNLKRNAKCTDGHVLTPSDVADSINAFLTVPKRTGNPSSNSLGGFGIGDFTATANDKAGTFTFASTKPYRNFLSQFAALPIICPAGVAALKADQNALNEKAYGSGPYQLVSAAHNDKVVWQLRPEWKWGPQGTSTATMPQTLIYRIVADETTAANLMLTGDLNLGAITGPDVQRLLADKTITHKIQLNYLIWPLIFNMGPGRAFDGKEPLREAIMNAVDRQNFLQAALSGRGVVTSSVFRPGSECYDASTKKLMPPVNLAKAKQILTKAGYTYSGNNLMENGKQVHLKLVMSQLMNEGPEYLRSVLANLGIDVDFQNLPGATYGTAITTGAFDIGVLRGTLVPGDAGLNLFPFSGPPPPQGKNEGDTGYGDTKLNYYLNTGLANPGANGCKVFSLYQKLLLTKHYVMPLIAANIDIFGKGVDFPQIAPDGGPMPVYYIKAAK